VLQSEKIVPSGLASAKPMDIALFAEARKCTATADRVRKMVLPNGNDGPVFRWLQIGFSGGGNRDVFQTASKELAAAIKMLIDARRYVYMIYDAYVSSDGFVGMHAVVVFGYTWVASSTGAVLGFPLDLMDPNRGEIKTEEAASGYKNPKVGIAALGADSLAGCTHFCSCYDPCPSQTPGPGDCVEWRGVDCDSCRGNVR